MRSNSGYINEDDLDADLFGEPDESTIDYIRGRVERFGGRMREMFDGFFEDSHNLFDRFHGEKALRRIRSRVRESTNIFHKDVVRPLRTIEDIQNARPTMQRYIMANAMARLAAKAGYIDGYSDTYMTPYPDRIGLSDPDFTRVIDGIIFDEDRYGIDSTDKEDAWISYQDMSGDPDERDLDVVQQMDILSTWDLLENMLSARQRDPTSVLNEKM